MACYVRSRNLKPGFFKNEQLAEMPVEARLLFAGLWCMADREGRLEDRPKRIKIELFPGDTFDIDSLLNKLVEGALITRYQSGEVRCIQVLNFLKHQHPHQKEPPSTLPESGTCPGLSTDPSYVSNGHAPDNPGASTGAARLIPSSLIPDSGSLIPESSPPERRAPRSPARKRCPEEFQITDDLRTWAKAQAPDVDVDRETERMRDWEFKTGRSDWPATWRTWMDRAQSDLAHRPGRKSTRRAKTADELDAEYETANAKH